MICPRCGRDDQIFKVKGIYERGLSIGSYSGITKGVNISVKTGDEPHVFVGSTTLHGETQTLLSQRLSPPDKPKSPGGPCFIGCVWSLLSLIIMIFLFGIFFPENYWEENMTIFLILIYGSLIFFGFVGVYLFFKKYKPKYTRQLEIWNKQMEIWKRLYYCARDNCIFDPVSKISDEPENLNKLLMINIKPEKIKNSKYEH